MAKCGGFKKAVKNAKKKMAKSDKKSGGFAAVAAKAKGNPFTKKG